MLVDLLEREPLPGLLVLDEVDRAVGSVGDQLHHVKVLLPGGLASELLSGDGSCSARVLTVRS